MTNESVAQLAKLAELSDVDVWRQLTLAEMDEMDESEPRQSPFSQSECVGEIDRRWGTDALERVAQVITAGKFSGPDELHWLNESPATFMKLVTGEETPEDYFARWEAAYNER
jgi:hypothetical protein